MEAQQASAPGLLETSGAQVFFGFDIKTWGNLPSSKQWQMRERGNLRIVFELQWETPLCDPLIATKLLYRGNLRIVFELQWETPLWDPQIAMNV